MKYVFYDVETTGLTGRDEVIQFGAIIADENLLPRAWEVFYCDTQVPIHKDAQKLHEIDAKTLHTLSNGQTFEDRFFKLPFVNTEDVVWISYSNGGFDERLITQTLRNNGLPKYNFGKKVNYLPKGGGFLYNAYEGIRVRVNNGKPYKLGQLVSQLRLTGDGADSMFLKLVGRDASFHDALYDAFCLWLVVYNYKELL